MPWKGVALSEQRENFIRDYRLGYYELSELCRRFGVSRKTGHKWIRRWEEEGLGGWRTAPGVHMAVHSRPRGGLPRS